MRRCEPLYCSEAERPPCRARVCSVFSSQPAFGDAMVGPQWSLSKGVDL